MKRQKTVSEQTVNRLMRYFLYLSDKNNQREWLTSSLLAKSLNSDETMIRKDLASIGLKGKARLGFNYQSTLQTLRKTIGLSQSFKAVIVGAGNLGTAIAGYPIFSDYGLNIVAIFDNNPQKIGNKIAGIKIFPAKNLKLIVDRSGAQLGIITCPAKVAQQSAEQLVAGGVKTIWNFAPLQLQLADNIFIKNENLAVGLAVLANRLNR